MIPYGRQCISQNDIDSVMEVLSSDFLTQGPQVPNFESKISQHCDVQEVVAFNSATSALHVACLSLGLGPGDWLWTTPITFVASANCGLYCGAKVDFVDIDSQSYNISIEALEEKLERAKSQNKLPKVLIPVHMCGQSCDMKAISLLSEKYGFKIIEDASHAIGGAYLDAPIGSCLFSDITVFSFHPVKIITTAEGGAATTKCLELAKKMRLFRSHGVTRDKDQMEEPAHPGAWYYQQIELGYNYRMTDLQAALGVSQSDRVNEFVKQRNILAERYDGLLKDLPLTLPVISSDCYSSFHLYIVRLRLDAGMCRDQLFDELRSSGIGVNIHYIPVHLQPYYKQLGFNTGDFPEAEQYFSNAISLPLYFQMTFDQQDEIVSTLKKYLVLKK